VRRLIMTFMLLGFSLFQSANATFTGGTDTVVSSITQTGATFTASITTDSGGSGSYALDFFVTAPYSGFVGGASPATVLENGNTTTSFSTSTTALTCGTTYTVAGIYLPNNLSVGPGYTTFTTLPCTPTPPTSVNPIPTLSEWAQIMMMLMMIATAGFYGWRMKQR